MNECAAFAAGVLTDLDGAGAFADFLDEHADPRGLLLRRRWRRWLKDRWAASQAAERDRLALETGWGRFIKVIRWIGEHVAPRRPLPGRVAAVDNTFRRYLRRKFRAELDARRSTRGTPL